MQLIDPNPGSVPKCYGSGTMQIMNEEERFRTGIENEGSQEDPDPASMNCFRSNATGKDYGMSRQY
jgi:hypothetical protein